MSNFDVDNFNSANADTYITNPDPLGLGAGGNLPEIAEAFRKTGAVCVGRTLRILSKSKDKASFFEDPSQIPQSSEYFGKSLPQARGSKSVNPEQSVGYATAMAVSSGGIL